ncbi:MAG: response regulator [Dehalococcoidia bacterium]
MLEVLHRAKSRLSVPVTVALDERRPVQVWGSVEEILRQYPDIPVVDFPEVPQCRLFVPLLRNGEAIGVFGFHRWRPVPFTEQQIAWAQTFADQAVIAIENARLFDEIQQKRRELEEANGQLAEASRHKSEFLASMSHELRTPLNAILGFSEVLLERMFGELNAKQDEYLHDILSSGQHLLSLINDILDLSKVEAGRMELELSRFSLPEALESSLTMIRERATRHGIALNLDVDPVLDSIEADERKVKQVLFNLLSNAVKFTPDGGEVTLVARLSPLDPVAQQAAQEALIVVRDSGVGIAPEDQGRIFEEFQQAGQGTTQQREGTGLGLTLTKRFVELHGGRIWVESQPGAGSSFSFTLPLQPLKVGASGAVVPQPDSLTVARGTTPPAMPVEAATAASGVGRAGLVLIVEDDAYAVDLLRLSLEGAGLQTVVARDGEEGLELARQVHPEAIVLDVRLPRLDGWEFLSRAKADPSLAAIPVIVVSMLDERGKGFALGASDYLVKPVGREHLLAALQRFTSTPNAGAERCAILAIDDDPLALELIGAILAPEGYPVLKATGGEAGLALARREQPGLIILDLLLPEMDGFATVAALKEDPATAAIPIVVLTSKSMSAADKERLNGRISYLAQKGEFDRAAFVALVGRFCGK